MAQTKVISDVRTLATGEVGAAALATNAVTGTKIAALAVNGAKIGMGSDARGDILFRDNTQYARLAAGTAGQVLTTGGAGADPSWGPAPALVPLRRVTGAQANYDFILADTDGVTYGAYRSFLLKGWLLPVTDDVELWFRTSADGSAYDVGATDYKYSIDGLVTGTTSGKSSTGDVKIRAAGSASSGIAVSNVAGESVQIDMKIEAPNEVQFTMLTYTAAGIMANNAMGSWWGTGARFSNAIMKGVRCMFESGSVADGDMTLYGIKNI